MLKPSSEYGTPATFGTRIGFYVFTTDIHRHSTTSPIDFGKAASLSSVLVLICILMWMLQNTVTARHTYRLVGGKGSRSIQKKLPVFQSILAWGYLLLIFFMSIGIPLFFHHNDFPHQTAGIWTAGRQFYPGPLCGAFFSQFQRAQCHIHQPFSGFCRRFHRLRHRCCHRSCRTQEKSRFPFPNIGGHKPASRDASQYCPRNRIMLFWNLLYPVLPLYNTLGIMILTYVVLSTFPTPCSIPPPPLSSWVTVWYRPDGRSADPAFTFSVPLLFPLFSEASSPDS